MRDVVVIGGGISGLVAALVLEQAQVPYTLIEVKRRFGGAAETHQIEGFRVDSGAMLHPVHDPAWLARYLNGLGLQDATFPVHLPDATYYGFAQGTGALVDALAAKITAPVMRRMAVSTLGIMEAANGEKRFSICMENGIVLDARALVIAAPARHSERMLHTLVPEAAYLLREYRYDSIARVSLGYKRADLGNLPDEPPAGYPITTLHYTQDSRRVPDDCVLVQAGIRFDADKGVPPDLVGELSALMGWPQNPLAEHVAYWSEADPIMWVDDTHAATMQRVESLLPPGVVLTGNDYLASADGPPALDRRMAQSAQAAGRILAALS